nr:hypothetical protein Iba_chr10dCG8950 [Ipomoea batatas]
MLSTMTMALCAILMGAANLSKDSLHQTSYILRCRQLGLEDYSDISSIQFFFFAKGAEEIAFVHRDLSSLFRKSWVRFECNLPNGVESDSLVVCNASSSFFDGDHDDIPDGCNPSAGGGGTSTDANADDSSIPAIFSNVLLIIPPPVLLLPISAITSPNSTTVSAIFLKTEVTFFKDSSDNSAWTFSSILSCTRSSSRSNRGITFPLPNCPDFTSDFILSLTFSSVHDVTAGDILYILFPLNSKRSRKPNPRCSSLIREGREREAAIFTFILATSSISSPRRRPWSKELFASRTMELVVATVVSPVNSVAARRRGTSTP